LFDWKHPTKTFSKTRAGRLFAEREFDFALLRLSVYGGTKPFQRDFAMLSRANSL
jgi:hypothetical protein